MPVRDLRVRELPPRFGPPDVFVTPPRNAMTFDVPSQDPAKVVVMEATVESGSGLDDWDLQTLGVARHVASLVLDADRGRLLRAAGLRRDGGHVAV